MSAKIAFRRQFAGSYFAEGATKQYAVYNVDGKWCLAVRELITTAGVRHALGQPDIAIAYVETKKLAVAAARIYDDLGDDFNGSSSRIRTALRAAYDAEIAVLRAGIAALNTNEVTS